MKNILLVVFLINLLFKITSGSTDPDQNVSSLKIEFDENQKDKFPETFHVEFRSLRTGLITFVKIKRDSNYPLEKANIYTVDSLKFNQIVHIKNKSSDMVNIFLKSANRM